MTESLTPTKHRNSRCLVLMGVQFIEAGKNFLNVNVSCLSQRKSSVLRRTKELPTFPFSKTVLPKVVIGVFTKTHCSGSALPVDRCAPLWSTKTTPTRVWGDTGEGADRSLEG